MDMSILFNGYDIEYLYLDKGHGRENKFATVQLKDKKTAENAIQMLNKKKHKGNEIKVKWTVGKTTRFIIILESSQSIKTTTVFHHIVFAETILFCGCKSAMNHCSKYKFYL